MAQTRQQFSSYIRIRSLSSQSGKPSQELNSAKADLEATLHELQTDLSDMHESVKAVEADPYAYGLEVEEVSRRRRFVRELEGEVEDMMEELKKTAQAVSNAPVHREDSGGSSFEDEQAAREWEQQQQQQIMAEQDEALEDVSRTIGNIRQHAHEMGRELEEQSEYATCYRTLRRPLTARRMLNAVGRDVDRVEDKLKNGMKKMAWVIKQNEGG